MFYWGTWWRSAASSDTIVRVSQPPIWPSADSGWWDGVGERPRPPVGPREVTAISAALRDNSVLCGSEIRWPFPSARSVYGASAEYGLERHCRYGLERHCRWWHAGASLETLFNTMNATRHHWRFCWPDDGHATVKRTASAICFQTSYQSYENGDRSKLFFRSGHRLSSSRSCCKINVSLLNRITKISPCGLKAFCHEVQFLAYVMTEV